VRKIELPATVRADLEVTLYGKVTGYVKTIHKDRGDRVKAGEIIATLEVPEMLLELENARASHALEETTLQRLEAVRKLERTAVTDQDLDLARAKRAIAAASLRRLETMLSYTEIRAPFGGTVTDRFVDPGAFVQQGKIVSLVDASKVRILVDVPEAEVRFAEVGTLAEVSFDALPELTVQGKVARSSEALDVATRTMRVEIELPNPEFKIRPGMFAHVGLSIERRVDALVIPSKAVLGKLEKRFVFVNWSGTAKRIAVDLGVENGEWVETTKGLSGNEAVIIPEGRNLVEGMKVQPQEGT
jgi:RND family efflux transporter MFP subunit